MQEKLFGRASQFFVQHNAAITAREINQQPRLWRELIANLKSQDGEIKAFMEKMRTIPNLRVIFTGAGSSAFIGEVLAMMFKHDYGFTFDPVATTDIVSAPDNVLWDVPTLLVSFSRSGESPESTAALTYASARIKQLYNLVVVCKKNSSLAKQAEAGKDTLVLNMPAESSDEGFAMTSSVSCMALGTWCAINWSEDNDRFAYIESLALAMEQQLDALDENAQQAATFDYRRLVFLGSSVLKGLAREGAVKSMELTNGKINAQFESSMGFRHGPKTVITPNTLTVHMISPTPHTARYDLDVAEELIRERRGNRVLCLAPEGMLLPSGADYVVRYSAPKGYEQISSYIGSLMFLQLLAMEKSILCGLPTDSPSVGGEVNRVVQGVTIYPI